MKVPSLEAFTWTVEERERIRKARAEGKPFPWTEDRVFKHYRFCNVNRNDDTVSQWLLNNIWNLEPPGLLANVVVHRLLSRLETCQELGWFDSAEQVASVIDRRRKAGEKVQTASFKSGSKPDRFYQAAKYFLSAEGRMVEEAIEQGKSLEQSYKLLNGTPGIGNFFAWQITADLSNTALLKKADDRTDWAAPGPGCLAGLRELGLEESLEGILQVKDYHNNHSDIYLSALDTQHWLCEFNKWVYTTKGRGQPKRRFHPNGYAS